MIPADCLYKLNPTSYLSIIHMYSNESKSANLTKKIYKLLWRIFIRVINYNLVFVWIKI